VEITSETGRDGNHAGKNPNAAVRINPRQRLLSFLTNQPTNQPQRAVMVDLKLVQLESEARRRQNPRITPSRFVNELDPRRRQIPDSRRGRSRGCGTQLTHRADLGQV
jgi:hypothetical protein